MHQEIALIKGIRASYQEGQTDYSMEPLVLVDPEGRPVGRIREGDGVVFCCRRGEREIQLTEAFVETDFSHFPCKRFRDLTFVALTLYHEKFSDLPVAFPPVRVKDTLGEVVSRHGLGQLRIAESEKFAHVTFFFNGGTRRPFPGEDDVRIPSPKGTAFDRVPELSLKQVTERVVRGISEGYDLTVVNFANGDVIGHVPQREARITCVEALDRHLGIVLDAARAAGTITLVTADHGILEEMEVAEGRINAGHTSNPVPFVLVTPERPVLTGVHVRPGRLADVAPTVLELLGVPKPEAMTGHSLLEKFPHDLELRGHSVGSGTAAGEKRRVLLLILDGWGLGREDKSNPIFLAHTPVWDHLTRHCPWSRLEASGEAVGLRKGRMGNSEAGHMNIGAGRVVVQDDVRLDLALKDGSFSRNEVFHETMNKVRQRNGTLHLIALLSEKSSHGTVEVPLALLALAEEQGLEGVCVHLILDGRSTEPGSAPLLLERFSADMAAVGTGRVVSCIGRGFVLDRDGNYEKTRKAYDAFVFGKGKACPVGETRRLSDYLKERS